MNQRLRQVIDGLKDQRIVYSDADFSRQVGISRSELSQMLSGKRKVSKQCLNGLFTIFPELNESWLIEGKGEILKPQETPATIADNHSTAVSGYQNTVNSDLTLSRLIDELAAQRRLTEAAQEALLTALQQNTLLINKLK